MKKYVLAIFILTSQFLFSQKIISKTFTRKHVDTTFSIDKVYNKITGKKVKPKKFSKLLKDNPGLPLEPVYNKNGEILKYLYDPNLKHKKGVSFRDDPPEIGEVYPNFEVKTIDGKKIELKDLLGKLVLLRFELDAMGFRFKKHEIEALDQKINESEKKDEIVAIIIFAATKDEVEKGFDLVNSNFNAVANGRNIQGLLKIKRFPYTVVIDKEGKLLDYYTLSERIDIDQLFKN